LIVVGLAAGGYFYVQSILEETAVPTPVLKSAEFLFGSLTITPSRVEVNKPVTEDKMLMNSEPLV